MSGSSTYPDLAVSATGNNATPYTFHVTGAAACGAIINFTLTVTYTGGASPQTFNFSIGTGAPGTPVTFSYTGPAVPIPDCPGADVGGTPAFASLPVVGVTGNVYSVKFSIDGTTLQRHRRLHHGRSRPHLRQRPPDHPDRAQLHVRSW